MGHLSKTNMATLIFGYTFLYLPIMMVVIFSFNESRLVTVWSQFSIKWYQELWTNEGLLDAVLASFKIASMTATLSVILGTLAAITMIRFVNFQGKTLFSGLISTPLVMPDVITGLAALIFFVTLEQLVGWPAQRGMLTIAIAHITLATAYVCLVVQARLQDFDHSLEEAALDLGARPLRVFLVIVLPLIFPSLLAGWLLAFALSLDDVVIASFLSGPGATTLPMLIFSGIRFGVSPVINALATIIIAIVAIGVTVAGLIIHHRQKRSHFYR